ncbi:hypothetical protein M404DRAFT_1001177, partial [Pisolithus tinctorius Marx 270]
TIESLGLGAQHSNLEYMLPSRFQRSLLRIPIEFVRAAILHKMLSCPCALPR